MSREYAQNQQVVYDLFGRDSGGYPLAYNASKAGENEAEEQSESLVQRDTAPRCEASAQCERAKVKPQFSEDLWEDALKRHCDARQNLRSLLDRYIKPHH